MKITQRFFIPFFLSLASCSLAGEVSQNFQDGVAFVNEDAGGAIIQNKKVSDPYIKQSDNVIKQNDNLIKETFRRDNDFSKGWTRTPYGIKGPVMIDILCSVSRGRTMEVNRK